MNLTGLSAEYLQRMHDRTVAAGKALAAVGIVGTHYLCLAHADKFYPNRP